MRSRVLLVAMADSVHVARWLEQLSKEDIRVELVSSSPHRKIHPKIELLLAGSSAQNLDLSISTMSRRLSLILWLLDRFAGENLRGDLLRRRILRFKPHVIHVLEFQHGGYMLNRVPDRLLRDRVVAVTNYGSDIFWFSRFPKHEARIRKLLQRADAYSAECARDERLARDLGFHGSTSMIFPNTGGLSDETLSRGIASRVSSERKVLLIKGYQNQFGRALDALRAIALLRKELKDYKIVIFSANLTTAIVATWLKLAKGMYIDIHMKGRLSHPEMLQMFSQARCYVGLSRSDGISTSLLEAMAMGAFPIQTGTACVSEWATDGVTAFIVNDMAIDSLANRIRQSLLSDELVDSAQILNRETIEKRYSSKVVGASVRTFYEELFDRAQD